MQSSFWIYNTDVLKYFSISITHACVYIERQILMPSEMHNDSNELFTHLQVSELNVTTKNMSV